MSKLLMSYTPPKTTVVQRRHVKIGRNEPCPCGSGKKYKKCCIEETHLSNTLNDILDEGKNILS